MTEDEKIAAIIKILTRNNRVPDWPDDEAAAYRDNGRWAEGTLAVNRLRAQKIIRIVESKDNPYDGLAL